MANGARKGFSVLTNANEKFIYKLVAYLNTSEFVTIEEIYLEYMTKPRRQFTGGELKNKSTSWNLMPTKAELGNFLSYCPVFTREKYFLIKKKHQKDATKSVGDTYFSLTTKWLEDEIFWSLSDDWSTKLSDFIDKLREKRDRKHRQARTQTGKKWAKHTSKKDTALNSLKLRGWNKNV